MVMTIPFMQCHHKSVPQIVISPENTSTVAGSTTVLACVGYGSPSVTWTNYNGATMELLCWWSWTQTSHQRRKGGLVNIVQHFCTSTEFLAAQSDWFTWQLPLPGLGFLWCTSLHMVPWKPTMKHMVPGKPTTKAYGPMKTYNEAYDHIALRCSCRRYQNRAPLQPSPILSMESKDQTSSIQTTQLQILTLENMQYKNRRITLLFFSQNLALSWKKGG